VPQEKFPFEESVEYQGRIIRYAYTHIKSRSFFYATRSLIETYHTSDQNYQYPITMANNTGNQVPLKADANMPHSEVYDGSKHATLKRR